MNIPYKDPSSPPWADEIYDFLQGLKFEGDGLNIVVDDDPTGFVIKYIGEETAVAETTSDGDTSVYPAEIISGGSGIYKANILNEAGESVESGVDLIATRATGYDLPPDSYVVAYKVKVDTLGSN